MEISNLGRGSVAHFSDGERVHTGLILDTFNEEAWVLFLTSNDTWSYQARKLTDEELSFFGFPKKEKQTFFAPVVRPILDATPGDILFPEHRVKELELEFGPSPLLRNNKYIFRNIKPKMPKRTLFDILSSLIEEQELQCNKQLMSFAVGKLLPRCDILSAIQVLPILIEEFFFRRESKTLGVQLQWSKSGKIFKKYRQDEHRSLEGLAQVTKLNPQDIIAFEEGIQCPSYLEMITICDAMPEIPQGFTIPTSIPFYGEVLMMEVNKQLKKNPRFFEKLSSNIRMKESRFIDLVRGKRPSINEMKRISTFFPGLPPYREMIHGFDWLKF